MILDILTGGRVIVSCKNMNLKIKLASILIDHLLTRGYEVFIIDKHLVLTRYLPEHIAHRVKILENPVENMRGRNAYVLVFESPRSVIEIQGFERIIVFTSTLRNMPRSLKGFNTVVIKTISNNTYSFHDVEEGIKVRFSIMGDEIRVIEKPGGAFGKALEILENAMVVYGELTTKDAIRLISRELGVSKELARRILGKLIEDKYIRILKGRISLV
ncbi:MAG: hypothetical protein QXU22_04670 [Desulfurococcaceae archaeon]